MHLHNPASCACATCLAQQRDPEEHFLSMSQRLPCGMVWYGMVSLNVRCRGALGPTLLMPAPEALCLRVALMSEMLVAQGEETVCGSSCNWIHKDCDVARLQQRGLAAVVHEHGHVAPDAAVVHDLLETATHVGLTWCQCNPRRWRFDAVGDTACAAAAHDISTSEKARSKQ